MAELDGMAAAHEPEHQDEPGTVTQPSVPAESPQNVSESPNIRAGKEEDVKDVVVDSKPSSVGVASKRSYALRPISQCKQPKKAIAKTIDRRYKVDLNAALKLYIKGISESEIGRLLNTSRQSINQALKPFKELIRDPDAVRAYVDNKAQVIDAIELEMLRLMTDKRKAEKATMGNIGYNFTQLHNAGRLEKDLSTANVAQSLRFTVVHEYEDGNPCQIEQEPEAIEATISCAHTPSEGTE